MFKKRKGLKITLSIILGVFILFFIALFIYTGHPLEPNGTAIAALDGNQSVEVIENKDYILFTPDQTAIDYGFIFYPGGLVKPEAYASFALLLAEQGVKVAIVKMPFNLAVFGINKADRLMALFVDIPHLFIGGHSLGGVMASSYVSKHSSDFEGLIFMASYPASDISDLGIGVLSMRGSNDTVLDLNAYNDSKVFNPTDTIYEEINGGNHTQFGDYALQKGDTEATISAYEQHMITIGYMMSFMQGE